MPIDSNNVSPSSSHQRLFTPRRLVCLAVVALSLLIYLPSLSGGFVWDDDHLIFKKGTGKTFAQCFTRPFLYKYYRPLTSFSFFAENRIDRGLARALDRHHREHNPNPFFYHQTNILFHVLATGMVLGLLGAAFPGRLAIQLVGGLLYAVQPAQVSAVAWIGGRTDAVCEIFVAAWLWAIVSCARQTGKKRRALAWLAGILYGLALLAKEQVMVLVPLVPLAFLCFHPDVPRLEGRPEAGPGDSVRSRDGQRDSNPEPAPVGTWLRGIDWRAVAPSILALIAFLASWAILLHTPLPPTAPTPARLAGLSILHYALLLALPTQFGLFALTLGAYERFDLLWAACGFALLGLSAWQFLYWIRRNSVGAWLLALTVLPILPVANILPTPSLVVAPYRAALCGIGAACLLGWAIGAGVESARKQGSRPGARLLWGGLASAIILWSTFQTVRAEKQWKSNQTLFTEISREDPYSFLAITNVARQLRADGDFEGESRVLERELNRDFGSGAWRTPDTAISAIHRDHSILVRAMESKGTDRMACQMLADIFTRLGQSYHEMRDLTRAESCYDTATRLDPKKVLAFVGMGDVAFETHRDDEAELWLKRAIAVDPKYVESYAVLGNLYLRHGDLDAARREYQACIRVNSSWATGYELLARLERRAGNEPAAQTALREAARLGGGAPLPDQPSSYSR